MNMKQKLTYMLIGCLCTLAGYILSSLFNTPSHVQAHDEKVIDEIVCKKLNIVNDKGITVGELSNTLTGGELTLTAPHLGNTNAKMSWSGLTLTFNGVKQTSLGPIGADIFGFLSINNIDGKQLVHIGSPDGKSGLIKINNIDGKALIGIGSPDGKGGDLSIYNAAGKNLARIGSADGGKSGAMATYNADGNRLVGIGSVDGGKVGAMEIYNAEGKNLVNIGSQTGRPNDGLINIYNNRGEWRSFSAD